MVSVGYCFHRDAAAGDVVEHARQAEALGFDELWVIEDCFFTAGPSLAAAALAATDRIAVGIGIMPAVIRNPALTAMEIATLAGIGGPGRFHAGIGHGVSAWMEQIGARPASALTALEETLTAVRRLLSGDEVTMAGRYVDLRGVQLAAPPDPAPLLSAGVRGPRSLAVAGRTADGTILADFCSPAYLDWARGQIDGGAGRAAGHRITVFASAAVATDGVAAREAMSYYLAEVCQDPPISLQMAPFYDQLAARAAASSWREALATMPADHWNQIGPIGTPDDAVAHLQAMAAAGADSVAIFPSPFTPLDDARLFVDEVVARLD